MNTPILGCIAALLSMPLARSAAQDLPGVPVGARVRVTAEMMHIERWITRVDSASGDTLFFAQREGTLLPVPVRLIDRLEVSEGVGYSRGTKALHVGLGYIVGGVGGGLIGTMVSDDPAEILKGSLILGVFTGIVTWREPQFGRGERWRLVGLPGRISVGPAGAGLISVRIAIGG